MSQRSEEAIFFSSGEDRLYGRCLPTVAGAMNAVGVDLTPEAAERLVEADDDRALGQRAAGAEERAELRDRHGMEALIGESLHLRSEALRRKRLRALRDLVVDQDRDAVPVCGDGGRLRCRPIERERDRRLQPWRVLGQVRGHEHIDRDDDGDE
jgi:hypothetical protein